MEDTLETCPTCAAMTSFTSMTSQWSSRGWSAIKLTSPGGKALAWVSIELLTVTIISLQSAGSFPGRQTNSQNVKCQHVHRRDRRHCQWYTKSLLNFWNDYLILFAANTKHTALLISSSCLPCWHECSVLTDCTVLGDVLCRRNALQYLKKQAVHCVSMQNRLGCSQIQQEYEPQGNVYDTVKSVKYTRQQWFML